jgi:hypothetical protein
MRESDLPRPRAAAAFAVPSAVSDPEARRELSIVGMRCFRGDVAGEAMVFLDRGEPDEFWAGSKWRVVSFGDGVRFLACSR